MDDDFDDFFDSPGRKPAKLRVDEENNGNTPKSLAKFDRSTADVTIPSTTAKPPAHPGSRPTSGVSRQTASQPHEQIERDTKRTSEAKSSMNQDFDSDSDSDYDYVNDEFVDDGSESDSGRKDPTPRRVRESGIGRGKGSKGPEHVKDHYRNERDVSSLDILSGKLSDSDDNSDVSDVSVSPLNSPLGSPQSHDQRLNISNHAAQKLPSRNRLSSKNSLLDDKQKLTKSKSGIEVCQANSDSVDLEALLKTVLSMETDMNSSNKRRQPSLAGRSQTTQRPGSSRLNYSFSNDQLRAIDRENERLLKRIMKHAADAKKAKRRPPPKISSHTAAQRPSSAAINRAKQLQKIEAENSMLLSRLQQTRPSRELQRDKLVGDFGRRSVSSGSGLQRPASAADKVPGHQRSQKQRPNSSSYNAGRRQSTDEYPSRPATVFATRPDDDDIVTWEDGY